MLESLHLENFTAFSHADVRFAPGLNVIIGQNGTGKTHLLKLGYLFNRAWPDLMYKRTALNRKRAEAYFEERLLGLFQPNQLNHLIRRNSNAPCRISAEVQAFIPTVVIETEADKAKRLAQFPFGSLTEALHWQLVLEETQDVALSATNANLDAQILPDTAAVNAYVAKSTFIPSKEIVSLYQGLIGLLERYEIKLDATYADLARGMNSPELASIPVLATGVLAELEQDLGGKLVLEGNQLVFLTEHGERTEGPLMAEGFRKLATLIYLIRHGAIAEQGETLFWDEPEANLNPAYIRWVAKALHWLAQAGLQVIVATHSLFFLRELEILLAQSASAAVQARFFGLRQTDDGVAIEQGPHIDDIGGFAALEESLLQSDRYLAAEI